MHANIVSDSANKDSAFIARLDNGAMEAECRIKSSSPDEKCQLPCFADKAAATRVKKAAIASVNKEIDRLRLDQYFPATKFPFQSPAIITHRTRLKNQNNYSATSLLWYLRQLVGCDAAIKLVAYILKRENIALKPLDLWAAIAAIMSSTSVGMDGETTLPQS